MSRQINVISREEWGGRKPKEELQPFPFPAKTVVMTLKTDFGECNTKEECIKKCQEIQNQHMDEWGLPDIAYNFLFGNDGNVYEARGWDFKPQRAIDNPEHGPQTYNIALIGDYRPHIPNSIHYQIWSWQDYGEHFKRLDVVEGYELYAWVDDKDTFDTAVVNRKHEEFLKKFPHMARLYRVPDIKFNGDDLLKQMEGRKDTDRFPYIPVH